jgi:hypothetical protein
VHELVLKHIQDEEDDVASNEDPLPLSLDVIEMVGNVRRDVAGGESVYFTDLTRDGGTATAQLDSQPNHIQEGDLVVLYDNRPKRGSWMFASVRRVTAGRKSRHWISL